jgi:cytochrome P450
MWKCHQKYGETVRYAPDRLLINTADAFRDIYSHKSNLPKATTYNALIHRAPNILTLRDKKQHGRRRRVMSQALSDSNIATFQPAILEQIKKFVAIFAELPRDGADGGWSPPINVSNWCDYLTFDIMASVVFSGKYDMLGSEQNRPVLEAILESNVRMGTLFQYPALGHWKIHKRFFPTAIVARSIFVSFVTRMVGDRIKLGKSQTPHDVFSFMAKAKDPETDQGLTMNELGAESTTLIVAGADTTSTAIAATMFYLAQFPQYLERAQSEVRKAFEVESEIRLGRKLNSCTFLLACINEAMRLTPSVGAALWRQVQSVDGLAVDGHFIPRGYDVGVGIWSLQHSPEHYPDPFDFCPERWLVESTDERSKILAAFSPFSRGPRSCVGKGIAMVELLLTLSHLLWSLDFKFPEGQGPPRNFELKEHVTGSKSRLDLQFRERQMHRT